MWPSGPSLWFDVGRPESLCRGPADHSTSLSMAYMVGADAESYGMASVVPGLYLRKRSLPSMAR